MFYEDFNVYGRMIYPLASSVPFFLFLVLIQKSLKGDSRKWVIASGLTLGLLFYVYVFAWTFAVSFTGLLLCLFLFKKDFVRFKKVLGVFLVGILFGAYNVCSMFFGNADLSDRMYYFSWSLHSREFIWSSVAFVALIIYLFYRRKEQNLINKILVFALILTPWIVLNQQMITGRLVQYGHYYWYFIVPLGIVAGLYMVSLFLPIGKLRTYFFALVICVAFLNTSIGQLRSIPTVFADKLYEQTYRPVLDRLNGLKSGVVLASNDQNSSLVAIYTANDLYWLDQAFSSTVPIERAKEALYLYLYMNKASRDNPFEYIGSVIKSGNDNMYSSLYKTIEGYSSGLDYYVYRDLASSDDARILSVRDQLMSEMETQYRLFARSPENIKELLKERGVEYLVWDKNKHPEWDLSFLGNIKKILERGGKILYTLNERN